MKTIIFKLKLTELLYLKKCNTYTLEIIGIVWCEGVRGSNATGRARGSGNGRRGWLLEEGDQGGETCGRGGFLRRRSVAERGVSS